MDLSLAIKNNDYSSLEASLKNGADANAVDENGASLLHQAANHGRERIAKLLLKHDANALKVTRDKGNTALHIAAVKRNVGMISTLLENVPRDALRKLLDAKTRKSGSTALHVAAKSHSYDIAKLLLTNGATFEPRDMDGKRPVDFVAGTLLEALLKVIEINFWLLEHGNGAEEFAEIHERLAVQPLDEFLCMSNCRNSEGRTLLQLAIKENRVPVVKTLLELRHDRSNEFPQSNVEALNKLAASFETFVVSFFERLPLLKEDPRRAVEHGNRALDLVRQLLRACGEYEREIGCRPLRMLNVRSIDEALEFLDVDHRGLLDFRLGVHAFVYVLALIVIPAVFIVKRQVFTAKLLVAAKRCDLAEVERCLADNVDVDARDAGSKRSPLHLAAFYGYADLARMLLEWHASLTCRDVSGNTPLHIAASNGHTDIVRMMLARNTEMVDVRGTSSEFTPLHLATGAGCLDTVKCLMRHGARYRIESRSGKKPIDMARDQEVLEFYVLVDAMFAMTTKGDEKVVQQLEKLKYEEEVMAVANARNEQGYNLAQTALVGGKKAIAERIRSVVELAVKKIVKGGCCSG